MWGKITPKFKVTTEIRSMLLADQDISDIIDDKIFPVMAPENTPGMYIIYQRDQYSIDRTKMGPLMEKCRVYINVVGSSYTETQDLAEKIFYALEGDHDNGLRIWLEDSTEDVIGEGQNLKYIQILLFEISNH